MIVFNIIHNYYETKKFKRNKSTKGPPPPHIHVRPSEPKPHRDIDSAGRVLWVQLWGKSHNDLEKTA